VTDEAGVLERFGVAPASIPDWLALAGDPADGIPGLPGFGAKTAAALLRRFLRVEEIPLEPERWDVDVRGKERLARTLRERRDEALLYRELATLSDDVPLPQKTVEDLLWRGANREALEELAARIGDREAIDRVPRWRET
jgi:5'-3' exonuclease